MSAYHDYWKVRDDAGAILHHTIIADRVFTTRRISDNIEETPEGFLLCKNVGLARTGDMDYGPREVPDVMWSSAARDGRITIRRFPEDVFNQRFLDSLNGKSVVVTHPEDNVSPENWKEHEVGIVLSPRRGEGVYTDLVVGDFLIKDAAAIKYIKDHLPEVSVGYEADYAEYEPGKWKQIPLIANHVALVDAGRCGSQCAIHDNTGAKDMRTRDNKLSRKERNVQDQMWFNDWRIRLDAAINTKDAAVIAKVVDEAQPDPDAGGDDDLHIHLSGNDGEGASGGRLDAIEGRVTAHDGLHEEHSAGLNEIRDHLGLSKDADPDAEAGMMEEAPQGTSLDAMRRTKDSAIFADGFQMLRAAAEILSPGIQMPTYDAALAPKRTYDAMCLLRRRALDRANLTPEGHDIIESALGGRSLVMDGMTGRAARTLFNSAVALMKARNTALQTTARAADVKTTADNKDKPQRLNSAAAINEYNRKHYGQPAAAK